MLNTGLDADDGDRAGGSSRWCGLLKYFPLDELGKDKLQAWELSRFSVGFSLYVAKRRRGGESSEDLQPP